MLIPPDLALMNNRSHFLGRSILCGLIAAVMLISGPGSLRASAPNQTVLYSTGFEAAEGFDNRLTLAGQNGWIAYGTGGNGLVTNAFEGEGQQAFVGYAPPQSTNDILNVWRPVVYLPDANRTTQVQFTVWMAIVDSTNRFYDDFRWSAYNTNSQRLFTLDFDNNSLLISYALDDGAGFVSTGIQYTNNTLYGLTINMDFTKNTWNATLNDQLVVAAKPITTATAPLNLGDVDAVWAIRDPGHPGNNYMVFDNYTLATVSDGSLPSAGSVRLEAVGRLPDGRFVMRLTGQPNQSITIEASNDFLNWFALKTAATGSDGSLDFVDVTAGPFEQRYYRARQSSVQ
jgi:hypothetical protein